MSGDVVSGIVDPATLYTKQQCIGGSTHLYTRALEWDADWILQVEEASEKCTKGMSQLAESLTLVCANNA
jgi:hypothetical protein